MPISLVALLLTTLTWDSWLIMMMRKTIKEVPVEVEEAEEVVVATPLKPKVVEDKILSKLSRRPRKTSPLYESTDP